MNRPSRMTYLAGNPVAIGAAGLGLVAFGAQQLTAGQGGWLALLFLIAFVSAGRANAQLRAFNAWQREWNAMGAAPARKAIAFPNLGGTGMLGPIVAWGLLACLTLVASGSPGMAIPVGLFWFVSAAGAGALMVRFVRGQHRRDPRQDPHSGVTVCLPVPADPVPLRSAYSALPQQLWSLFQ